MGGAAFSTGVGCLRKGSLLAMWLSSDNGGDGASVASGVEEEAWTGVLRSYLAHVEQ